MQTEEKILKFRLSLTNDYGDKAEKDMASKGCDYFADGTLVVWDVDVLKEEVIRVYRASNPEEPHVYHPSW